MPSSLTTAEAAELARLLRKVKDDRGWLPDGAAMRAAHNTFSFWAPEIVIQRRRKNNPEILLAVYGDGVEEFRGMWHIPGGYNRPWYVGEAGVAERTVQDTISRIALREIGADVRFTGKVIGMYWWPPWEEDCLSGHPYGRPLSIYCECEPLAEIKEREDLRFFRSGNLPHAVVPPHRSFIEQHIL